LFFFLFGGPSEGFNPRGPGTVGHHQGVCRRTPGGWPRPPGGECRPEGLGSRPAPPTKSRNRRSAGPLRTERTAHSTTRHWRVWGGERARGSGVGDCPLGRISRKSGPRPGGVTIRAGLSHASRRPGLDEQGHLLAPQHPPPSVQTTAEGKSAAIPVFSGGNRPSSCRAAQLDHVTGPTRRPGRPGPWPRHVALAPGGSIPADGFCRRWPTQKTSATDVVSDLKGTREGADPRRTVRVMLEGK